MRKGDNIPITTSCLQQRCHIIPLFPSLAMHVPWCDYVLTPTEYVGHHRNDVSDEGNITVFKLR